MTEATAKPSAVRRLPVAAKAGRGPKKSELVARTIAHELFTQQTETGALIDVEDDLVKRLHVSRGTLREGLRLLEVLGVIESRIGRSGGIVVQRPSAEHFAQIITFYLQFSGCTYRQLLEVYAEVSPLILGIAASQASESDRTRLRVVMVEFDALPIDRQVRHVPAVSSALHDMIDNPLWALLAKSFHAVISGHLEALLVPESDWPSVVRMTRRMTSAVLAGDTAKAESLGRAQVTAWLKIAARTQQELLDSPIVWATDDDLFITPRDGPTA